jgi:hypothetical protein
MTQAAERPGQHSAGNRGQPDAADPQDREAEVMAEEPGHGGGGEPSHVVAAADVQRRGLTAGQQEQAVVQGRQVGRGEQRHAAWLEYPAQLAQGRPEVLHGHQFPVPDHQVKPPADGGKRRFLDVDPDEIGRRPDRRVPAVLVVVDDRALRPGELVAEEQGVPSLPGVQMEKTAPARSERPDQAADLRDHRCFDVLMPACS